MNTFTTYRTAAVEAGKSGTASGLAESRPHRVRPRSPAVGQQATSFAGKCRLVNQRSAIKAISGRQESSQRVFTMQRCHFKRSCHGSVLSAFSQLGSRQLDCMLQPSVEAKAGWQHWRTGSQITYGMPRAISSALSMKPCLNAQR